MTSRLFQSCVVCIFYRDARIKESGMKRPNHSTYFIVSMKFDISFGIIYVTKIKLLGMEFGDIVGRGGGGVRYDLKKSSFHQYFVQTI